MNPIVESLLLRSAVLFLMLGSLAGLVVGGLLIQSPHRLRKIGDILNRWVSTRHLDQTLDRSIDIDPWFYRHHRVCAGLILRGLSIFCMHLHSVWIGQARSQVFPGTSALPPSLVGGLLDALVLSALSGALFAAFCQFAFVAASQHVARLRARRKPLGFVAAGTEITGNTARRFG